MSEENGSRPGSETATLEEANALAANSGTDWLAEIKSIALLILAVLAFHSFIAKPFYIPSESMMPVLLKGDRLVVSKFAYGWSYVSPSFHILPEMPGRVLGKLPERGDIVIAQPRGRSEDYIKRVIGLPGDTLEVRGGQLILNGQSVPQAELPPLAIPIDADAPCDPIQFPAPSALRPMASASACCPPARKPCRTAAATRSSTWECARPTGTAPFAFHPVMSS
jgi:signal peptidase I